METNPLYTDLLAEVQGFFQAQPDKPEETPAAVLRALWFSAAGTPLSVVAVDGSPLPKMDEAGAARLKDLVARKRDGVPLAHLTQSSRSRRFMSSGPCPRPSSNASAPPGRR